MKRTKTVLKLKKGIKTALLIGCLEMILLIVLFVYCDRVQKIENNPNGYTESGHAHSVNVQIIR